MAHYITRKLDFEKGKLRPKAQTPDYQDRFREEGSHFDRGGAQASVSSHHRH